MEELLVILLQLLGEVLLQLFAETLFEIGFRAVAAPFRRFANPLLASLGYLLLGAAVGALSLWPFPSLFIHSHVGRIVNVVITPVLAGTFMAGLGAWREKRGQETLLINRFAYGALFALAMALVRLRFGG